MKPVLGNQEITGPTINNIIQYIDLQSIDLRLSLRSERAESDQR